MQKINKINTNKSNEINKINEINEINKINEIKKVVFVIFYSIVHILRKRIKNSIFFILIVARYYKLKPNTQKRKNKTSMD